MESPELPSDAGDVPQPGPVPAARSGVRLRMLSLGDFERACAELERDVQGLQLRGLTVTLEVDRAPTAPELRRLEEFLLDRHGAQLLQLETGRARLPGEPGRPDGGRAALPVEGGQRPGEPSGGWAVDPTLHVAAGGEGRRGRPRGHRGGRPTARPAGPVADLPAALGRPGSEPTAPGRGGADSLAAAWRWQGPGTGEGAASGWADAVPTMLVKRTLRSGQRIRFAGNVVVLGDVNPGAEVVAAGDIVVMGTLRGVAHAGATGVTDAIVAAFRLHPTQLRVAGVIGRAPDGLSPRPDAPEVARVRDGVLVVERYVP
jgi:septum site-determining protein MinC